jgi:hypothetical protein
MGERKMEANVITERQKARELARECAELCVDSALEVIPEARAMFWQELLKIIPAAPAPVAPPSRAAIEPFSDHQARCFGASKMPFGKHQGQRIDEVPIDYLAMLAEGNEWTQSLRRYLASERIQSEQPPTEGE